MSFFCQIFWSFLHVEVLNYGLDFFIVSKAAQFIYFSNEFWLFVSFE